MGKTIAQELFAIAEAQGGTASGYPRTIAGAVDALTDALAGSDVDSGRTIAEAVAVMGEYIGGGGGNGLTLATITVVGSCNIDAPCIDGDMISIGCEVNDGTVPIVLYNGEGRAMIYADGEVSTSGGITFVPEQDMYFITGDGTVTISS